jgi:hypothetical protein
MVHPALRVMRRCSNHATGACVSTRGGQCWGRTALRRAPRADVPAETPQTGSESVQRRIQHRVERSRHADHTKAHWMHQAGNPNGSLVWGQ